MKIGLKRIESARHSGQAKRDPESSPSYALKDLDAGSSPA